jgi:hypothetical protein
MTAFTLIDIAKAQDSTSSAESIREKVQEKVTKALNSPRAYIGTVTDISSTTLQIRKFILTGNEKAGEIQQIATSSDTVFVSVGKTTKSIKFTDIAIGDFIIAMGYRNGNNVLESRRILVTEVIKPSNRTAVSAKVTKIMRNTLEVTTLSNEKLTLEQEDTISILSLADDKQTKIRFADIEEEDLIIAVGTLDNNIFSARKILVISSVSPTATPSSTSSPNPTTTP